MNGFCFFAGGVVTVGVLFIGIAIGATLEEKGCFAETPISQKSGRYSWDENEPEETTEEDS